MTSDGYETDRQLLLTNEYANTRWNTLAALIRGIRDLDRLQALLEAEIEHQQRQSVIAHLNRHRHILKQHPELTKPVSELEQCPDQDANDKPEPRFLDEDGNEYERTSVDSKIRELTAEVDS